MTTTKSVPGLGVEMHRLAERLFPICRSLTGEGVRESLRILEEHLPLEISEVPSGEQVFDWNVPDEWNVRNAYIVGPDGRKVVDFRDNNLHLVGYSVPFRGTMSLASLRDHLHTLEEQPDVIPYVTSYYARRWGFCLTHRHYERLREGSYEIVVDTDLKPGSMTYAELVIQGRSDREILLSTYVCHPSMANNELSGPVVATFLARALLEDRDRLRYTYRFVFVPETVGAIAYVSRNLDRLRERVVGGYVISCVGDPGPFSYLQTPSKGALVDRMTRHVLQHATESYRLYDFTERGSDERQYNAPGVDLGVGVLMRTKFGEYPEYHTSADDLSFVTPEALQESLRMYRRCIDAFEQNYVYRTTVLCEPQLGKRGLYPTLSTRGAGRAVRSLTNLLAYADGKRDLIDIAETVGVPIWDLHSHAKRLTEEGLLRRVDDVRNPT